MGVAEMSFFFFYLGGRGFSKPGNGCSIHQAG